FDKPYTIIETHPVSSMYMLDLPNSPNIFLMFHFSQLCLYHTNDPNLFPSRELPQPRPVL
ncbi:hypothetical protein P692DRAFT_201664579, partial [Suillus brevipes Sb2]